MQNKKFNLIIGISGSVAVCKIPELIGNLVNLGIFEIKIVSTKSAAIFLKKFNIYIANIPFYTDDDEWNNWNKIGDDILHIELRKWADLMIIVPTSANTLAKMANGLCDNLLTMIFRAWDFEKRSNELVLSEKFSKYSSNLKKPIILAPAMNTFMYENPITFEHFDKLKNLFSILIMDTQSKKLACNDIGRGALESIELISLLLKEISEKL